MKERRLTNKQEWRFALQQGTCPKCQKQTTIVASRYIENGSEYTFSCPDHGYFSLSMTVKPKARDTLLDNLK